MIQVDKKQAPPGNRGWKYLKKQIGNQKFSVKNLANTLPLTLRRWIIGQGFIKDIIKNSGSKVIQYFDDKYPYKSPAPIKNFMEFLVDVTFFIFQYRCPLLLDHERIKQKCSKSKSNHKDDYFKFIDQYHIEFYIVCSYLKINIKNKFSEHKMSDQLQELIIYLFQKIMKQGPNSTQLSLKYQKLLQKI